MASFFEHISFLMFVCVFRIIEALPKSLQKLFVSFFLNAFLLIKPQYKNYALLNITQAFPNKSEQEKLEIFNNHKQVLVSHFIDIFNIKNFNSSWAKENLKVSNPELVDRIKNIDMKDKGVLIVSGHLSSFEVLPHFVYLTFNKMSYVVRAFNNKKIDAWWNKLRCFQGNEIIYRKQAYRNLLKRLKSKEVIGILFDQNVTRSNATFIKWFKRKAATTKAPALALLHTNATCIILNLKKDNNGKFVVEYEECEYQDIVSNDNLSKNEKINKITQRMYDIFEKFVYQYPENWFWMHRRWKTTESEDIPEDFYGKKK